MNTDDIVINLKRMFSRDIGLSVDWQNPKAVSVSWYDPVTVEQADGKKLKGTAGHIAIGLLAASLVLPFVFQSFWPLILLPVLIAYVPMAASFQGINKKVVAIDTASVRFNDYKITPDRVSRVAVSAYEDWYDLTNEERQDSNKIPFKRMVELWVDDRDRIELSRNSYSKETNLYIKNAIEDALASVQKSAVKEVQEDAHGKAGDFGMPDY